MAGKLEELSYEISRYHWNILGLCKVQLHNRKTLARHPLYFIGKADKHNQGIGFLVHKDIVNTVMGCRPGAGGGGYSLNGDVRLARVCFSGFLS